jgi:hypothetical protein
MKCYLFFLSLFFIACKRENTDKPVSIDALIVNETQVSSNPKFAVGQFLKIRPHFNDSRSDLTISWMLTPNANQPFEENESLLVWRPASTGKFNIDLNVKSTSGKEVSKQYTFETIPADIRYNLWGSSYVDVDLNEQVNESEYNELIMQSGGYIIKNSDVSNGRNDNIQPGESIFYFYNDKMKLTGAEVAISIPGEQDAESIRTYYEAMRLNRLSDYTYVGHDNQFASPEYVAQYQDHPELWTEAVRLGRMVLIDVYENERTTVMISWAGGYTITLNYSAKQNF